MSQVGRSAHPTVSVALCTHNGAAFLAAQVRTILEQRPEPIEIVVGDDASTDRSLAVVTEVFEQERARNPRLATELVVRRHDPALGVAGNFADAMSACRGDLIALSDQDDVWAPNKLSRLVARFVADPALRLAHSDARLIDSVGGPLGLTLLDALEATAAERDGLAQGDAFAVLLRRNLVTGATVVLRRDLLEAALPIPADWIHDEWLAVVAAALDADPGGVRLEPEPLIDYRQHGGNEIGARRPTLADRWARLREPRVERAPRLERRARQLAARLGELGVADGRLEQVQHKVAHEARRAALPRVRLARVPGVLVQAARGRYRRYSRGWIDILRDLVQPAGRKAP